MLQAAYRGATSIIFDTSVATRVLSAQSQRAVGVGASYGTRIARPPLSAMSSNTRKRPLVSSSAQAPGFKKRKTDPSVPKFYAVRIGMRPGVYRTWDECQAQTAGFKGASYKSFLSLEEAQAFVAGKKIKSTSGEPEPPKFYAVAKGAFTGIFTDWDQASKAIKGQKGPKYKKFPTREEAVQFIKEWGDADAIAALGEKVSDAESSDEDDSDEEDDELDVDGDRLEVEESSGAGKKKKGGKAVLDVYTDGSSLKNGRVGAAAGVGVFFGIGDTRNISERLHGEPQTNQRAELMAILRALQVIDAHQSVQIITDSQYSINCATVWASSWEKNDWKTAQGENVKNQDLVKGIRQRVRERTRAGGKTTFKWVKGHANDAGNQAADQLAVAGARKALW